MQQRAVHHPESLVPSQQLDLGHREQPLALPWQYLGQTGRSCQPALLWLPDTGLDDLMANH